MNKEDFVYAYYQMRDDMKEKWNRVLPFGELVSDRWEKARYLGFGAGTSVYDNCIIIGDVEVGNHTWIGPYTLLDGSGGKLLVGNGCDISAGVQIYTHDTVLRCVSGGIIKTKQGDVVIGDKCYIAPMSVITRGVQIGDMCIVTTGSFVNRSYEARSIIAGCPAIKIGEVVEGDKGEVLLRYFNKSE